MVTLKDIEALSKQCEELRESIKAILMDGECFVNQTHLKAIGRSINKLTKEVEDFKSSQNVEKIPGDIVEFDPDRNTPKSDFHRTISHPSHI